MEKSSILQLEEIVERVFHHLPMKSLHVCARVCKKWEEVVRRKKHHRKKLSWLLHDKDDAENIEKHLHDFFSTLPSEPRLALAFCSSSLLETKLAVCSQSVPTSSRFPRAAKMERMTITDYLTRLLPRECKLAGAATDGVVGCRSWGPTVGEFENREALSCLFLPQVDNVEIRSFHITPQLLDQVGPFNMTTQTVKPDDSVLATALGLPANNAPKLVLMFETEPGIMRSQDTELDYMLLRCYERIVIAGGYVDSPIPEEDSANTNCGEALGLGIAFCGENIKVASVLIGRHVRTKNDVRAKLQKLKSCNVPEDNLMGFMFACMGRGESFYQEPSVEANIFRAIFPNVPLVGFFGNGETGYDYLPDYALPEGDSKMSLMGQYPDDESGYVWDMPPLEHSYSTVFVLMSLGRNAAHS